MSMRRKKISALVATAVVGIAVVPGMVGTSPANADPKQFSALVGFGSDTTQDILNAFSGFSNGVNYEPLQTSATTGYTQLASWDAFPANECIGVKPSAPLIHRPNGSSQGRRILSRAFGGGQYGTAACGVKDVSGLVDFARSSAGPAAGDLGTDLTYLPFGRDALTFAYYRPGGEPVTNLSTTQIRSLFSSGPAVIDGVVLIPCGIQTGSGTKQSWDTTMQVTPATEATATAFCNNAGGVPDTGGRLQESNGPELKTKGDVVVALSDPICDGTPGGAAVSCAAVQVVVGFSASQFVARSNGAASPVPPPEVRLGGIDGNPAVNGTAPNVVPNAAFYSSATYGRDVYNVLPTASVTDPNTTAVKEMFVGAGSAVCSPAAQETTEKFGFLPLGAACGSTTLTGSYFSGQT